MLFFLVNYEAHPICEKFDISNHNMGVIELNGDWSMSNFRIAMMLLILLFPPKVRYFREPKKVLWHGRCKVCENAPKPNIRYPVPRTRNTIKVVWILKQCVFLCWILTDSTKEKGNLRVTLSRESVYKVLLSIYELVIVEK